MVKLINNTTRFDFNLVEIAALFGITLNDELPEREQCVLVLAPVVGLVRELILKNKPVPGALWDIVLTLSNHIQALIYPDIDE